MKKELNNIVVGVCLFCFCLVGYGNPIPIPVPASMPIELMNISINPSGEKLHADFEGDFIFNYIPAEVTHMKFPVPPDATNIIVKQDGILKSWTWDTDTYPTVVPEMPTIPMIKWDGPFPEEGAIFSVYYDHDLFNRNEQSIFFYAVGTGKYFPTYDKITTATFNIEIPEDMTVAGVWLDNQPHTYTIEDTDVTIIVNSHFGPIKNDLIMSLVKKTDDTLRILSVEPVPVTVFTERPDEITAIFNRPLLSDSVNRNTCILARKGSDGIFNQFIKPESISLVLPDIIKIDLSDQILPDDVYKVTFVTDAVTTGDPDAEFLAMDISGELRPPQLLYEQIHNDLEAIRSLNPSMHAIHQFWYWYPGMLLVKLTPDAWSQYLGSIYHGLDALNGIYGPVEILNEIPSSRMLILGFETAYNPVPLADIYATAEGVESCHPNWCAGDGDWIEVYTPEYIMSKGWGDCPAGCIYRHFWRYLVTDGNAVLVEEYGSPLEEQLLPPFITDIDGNRLDGEFNGYFATGDGTAGGDCITTFAIQAEPHIQYTFDRDCEGWQFAGEIPPFDEPATSWWNGPMLRPCGSFNCFSFWESPLCVIEDGALYKAMWEVGTTCTDAEQTSQFRLRTVQQATWSSWERVVSSRNDQSPCAVNSKSYNLFFSPEVDDPSQANMNFCFDIMSFDPLDYAGAASSISLNTLVVDKLTEAVGWEYKKWDFRTGVHDWTFAGKIGVFDAPITTISTAGLGFSPVGSTRCFSYWASPEFNTGFGGWIKVYRVWYEIGSSCPDPDDSVQFRLRINRKDSWQAWNRVINSNCGHAPSSSESKTYELYFDNNSTCDADKYVEFAFDIMSFDSEDDTNSILYIKSLQVDIMGLMQ